MQLKVDGIIRPIFWEHWQDPEAKFDKKEKAKLISNHTKGEKINIIAKSIGTLVASYVIENIPEQINKVIVCGIPLNDIGDEEKSVIKKALFSLPKDNLICFQNFRDPHGSLSQVKSFLPPKVKLIHKERSDHEYPYFDEFNEFLK